MLFLIVRNLFSTNTLAGSTEFNYVIVAVCSLETTKHRFLSKLFGPVTSDTGLLLSDLKHTLNSALSLASLNLLDNLFSRIPRLKNSPKVFTTPEFVAEYGSFFFQIMRPKNKSSFWDWKSPQDKGLSSKLTSVLCKVKRDVFKRTDVVP